MGKKIIYIIIGALLIFGILFLLWSFFFSGGKSNLINNGQFGTASDTNEASGTNIGGGGNSEVGLGAAGNGQNAGNGQLALNGNGGTGIGGANSTGLNGGGPGANGLSTSSTITGSNVSLSNGGVTNISGVTWLGSGAGDVNGASGNGFNPTGINGINGATLGGTAPTIGGTVSNPNSSSSGINILLASGLIGAASCALQASRAGITASGASASAATSATTPGILVNGSGALIVADYGLRANATVNGARNGATDSITFAGCITNVLAKAALQQITASVVNWINSGFNGQPSFITNYEQFFTNVADLAAGQFIQGAGLSFLCSPFKLQIKVAIAQSYANRGSQSCSLTGIIRNVNSFMSGNFSQGGWPGLISFTTIPANNPYGAYAYGQIGLSNAQNAATANAKNNISPTGFLAVQKLTCNGATTLSPTLVAGMNSQAALSGGSGTTPNGCKASITTPGTVIESTLASTLDTPLKQLGLANDIDQILNALTTQLITKTLQNGLSSLSGTTGYQSSFQTPEQAAAQAQAQTLLTNLQAQGTFAVQYGTILQGSIGDIENAQSQLNNLANCWKIAASSTSVTASQAATASANAASTLTQLNSLNPQIDSLNNTITSVNNEIAILQQLQSEALSVGSTADVAQLTSDYNAAQSTQQFITQGDVTTAQQNRTTLQAQMSSLNATTAANLAQCRALGQ